MVEILWTKFEKLVVKICSWKLWNCLYWVLKIICAKFYCSGFWQLAHGSKLKIITHPGENEQNIKNQKSFHALMNSSVHWFTSAIFILYSRSGISYFCAASGWSWLLRRVQFRIIGQNLKKNKVIKYRIIDCFFYCAVRPSVRLSLLRFKLEGYFAPI